MIKVLSIGSDKSLFLPGSDAQKRIKQYGELFEELHIIVFSRRKSEIISKFQISENVWAYPTNSRSKWLYILDAYKIAKQIIRNSRNDAVISCQDPFESGLVGWFLKLRCKLPLQLQIHTDVFNPYFYQESWKNKLRVLLAKFLLPRADGIRVVSERIKQSLLTLCPKPSALNPIVVLPIFVDVKKIQSTKIKINLREKYSGREPIILMASRLTREKNIGLAIEAMAEEVKKFPKALLLIVGDGPERQNLEFRIQNLELNKNVKFEPWTNDLASYYKTADLFLLTSNYEGYGRTVAEAMAAGLPVISTDVGLAGEVLIDDLDGLIIPVGSQTALENAILNLVNNPEKQTEFSDNSLKVLANFPGKEEYFRQYRLALESIKYK